MTESGAGGRGSSHPCPSGLVSHVVGLLIFALFFILLVFAVFRFFWLRKSMQTEIRMERLDREKRKKSAR